MRMTGLFRSIGFYTGLLLFCVFAIFPAVWMLITAFKSNTDLYNPTNNLASPGVCRSRAVSGFCPTTASG